MKVKKLMTIKLTKVGKTILKKDIQKIEKLYRTNKLNKLEKIGWGCFGTVYKYKATNGKVFAIKYAKKEYNGANITTSHDIETLLLLRKHRHFVKIHAYDDTNLEEYFLMVMDYVEGENLVNFTNDFPLSKSFINYYKKTLDYLIENNISINDLHGNNVMINKNGLPIIVDYGGLFQVENKSKLNKRSCYGYESTLNEVKNTYKRYTMKKKQSKKAEKNRTNRIA